MICLRGTPTKERQWPQPKTAGNPVSKGLQRCQIVLGKELRAAASHLVVVLSRLIDEGPEDDGAD